MADMVVEYVRTMYERYSLVRIVNITQSAIIVEKGLTISTRIRRGAC